ncbi:response regulator [Mangrovibacterium sp.]|uniref:response regulator n=1 Tax=Mangrovibacterium sp. TaxID=1961364 RepID=UPI0035670859
MENIIKGYQKSRPLENLTLLVVEDDLSSARLLKTLLKKYINQVNHVLNGEDAIAYCQENPHVQIILMDIKMPGIDGLETTRRIRTFNKDVVIIAQTAYALDGDKEKALQAGCNDYISKPINKVELLTKLESLASAVVSQ